MPFDNRTLTTTETLELFGDGVTSELAGVSFTIFVGYTVDDYQTIIYNSEGIPFSVQ